MMGAELTNEETRENTDDAGRRDGGVAEIVALDAAQGTSKE